MTLFTKTINKLVNVFAFGILIIVFDFGLSVLLKTIQSLNIPYLEFVELIIFWLKITAGLVLAILLLTFMILITINIVNRILYDGLFNWFKSFLATYKLRKFMRLEESKEDSRENNQSSKIYKQYNKLLKHCYVDLDYSECLILIKAPATVQVTDLLTKMLQKIRDYVANEYPDYKFSPFKKDGKYHICLGGIL
ncbi:hypothetical protein [Streptococcus acidominimus]|uniref:Membrane protein n=1 Tax=Streptococcus acidominimus TaxID=1326 RepID=A0A1Q8E718_STRAI|nr:hypothetical protein [Streptococcus acidominimus]OLF47581.1 hypothetical protein BU200_10135 [Streptococcus acidominimus]SUN08597.1 membrane protein [Streptococcus acidominimus]